MPTSFHTVLAVVTVLSFGLSLQADPPINPIPRAVKSTILYTWDFEDSAQGWVAENQCTLSTTNGQLLIRSTGSDPYMHSPVDFPGGQVAVQLRVRCKVGGAGSVFWTTDKFPRRGEDQRADFSIPDDGQWHETQTRFQAPGRLKDLRIDPGFNPGLIEIDWIRIVQEELHPLSISAVEQKNGIVRFLVSNDRDMAVTFQLDAATRSVPANDTLAIDRPIPGTQPLESVSVTLDCESWPPLTRSVWVANPQVQTRWIEKSLDGFNMKIAQNGSVAFVYRGDQLVATLGPLVLCDGQLPDLKPGEDGAAIRFEGDDIRLSLTPQGSEVTVHVDSTRHCEGPVVRAVGSLEQGLFAGLEYLGKGESSSSRLDIETDEHVRFAPDPMKVTLPLMTFVTDRASIAVTWNDMTLQPVYATPNFFDGSEDHRMTLQGRDITATIRFDTSPLEDSIAWAVEEHGLPVLPPAPRTNAEQSAICLAALNGPLKTKDGWGHCAQENWARQPFADMASTLWRLGGDVPTFDRFAFGGAHVPNGTIYFVTGRAQQWLDIQRQQVRNHIQGQQADGSYRYNGKYRRGHFEDTASGVCALPAARLLEFAYITGDQEALDAGLRTLEFMKRFRTPRGAQVWEVPLHTPDQLASAYLVWAYTRGYQLTGNREYLQHARKWALSGLPFTYLWSSQPIMAYSTPPVFGATNWIAPNWMGLPVQWVGGVYAYALTLLAPHEKTLDWNHVARGILVSAQQQQYPDGPHLGLLPDSFNIQHQRRQPADINPCALVSLQLALDGQVDFLDVAVDGDRRAAAPFPVTIHDGAAHINAKEGVDYQILVDGRHVIDVKSQGQDTVPLPPRE